MFVEDYYRRLVARQLKLPNQEIKTDRPWQPRKVNKKNQQFLKEDCKFFMLPPNKMVTLLKKHKILPAPNDKIREFLKNHSLKQIVDYGQELQSTPHVKIQRPSFQLPTPRQSTYTRQLFSIKRKPIQLHSIHVITEPSKKSFSHSKDSIKLTRLHENEHHEKELFDILRKINNSPLHMEEEYHKKEIHQRQKTPQNQPYLKPEIPKSVLPYPPRTKKQLRQFLIRALKKIKALGLTIRYVMQHKIFSKKPYEKVHSKEFILAAKKNKIEEIENLLQISPYLVFDYDFYNMTALHWACKKGYYNIAELLLNYQSDIDGVDILYRTPLILSIEENHLDVTQLLLSRGAYPWSTAVSDLKSVLDQNESAKNILTRVRRLQIMAKWTQSQEYLNLI